MAQPYQPLIKQLLLEFECQRLESAERIARSILRINSKDLIALQVQGLSMAMQGRLLEATEPLSKAATLDPKNQDLLTNLAKAQFGAELFEDAIKSFERLNKLSPNQAPILTDLGTSYAKMHQYESAENCYEKAIQLNPEYFLSWSNKGNLLAGKGLPVEAIRCYEKSLSLNSNYAEAWTNYGNALFDLGRFEEACDAHDKAISLDPNYGEAWHNKANALTELKQEQLALEHYSRAYEIKPQVPLLIGQLINSLAMICRWKISEGLATEALRQVEEGKLAVHPFVMLQTEADAGLQLQAAKTYIRDRVSLINSPQIPIPALDNGRRIRIAYFSSDFKSHPVGILMENLITLHDRSRFEISGYFLGKKSGDSVENRLINLFDHHHDIFGINDIDAHRLILEHNIDIAVDLNGHTAGARTGLFARRIAPIQLNYLGFAGTSGADFYDYILADQIAVPPDQQPNYSEKLAYLPNSFFPADSLIPWGNFGPLPTRESQGLPNSGFIFACFNNSYKITSKIFSVWMNLLKEIPSSVLWLTKPSASAIINLQERAQNLGVDPLRIIFAKRVPDRAEHLSRLRLIDLFLDTPNFNAHTTAADALWAGVPVLTKLGDTFASRVAASQLNALGMDELIVNTEDEYRERALQLAKNPDLLMQLRLKLEANRLQAPLFNTPQYVKDLEALYLSMLNV